MYVLYCTEKSAYIYTVYTLFLLPICISISSPILLPTSIFLLNLPSQPPYSPPNQPPPHRLRINLIHCPQSRQTQHEHPNLSAPPAPPQPPLNAHFPRRVQTKSDGVHDLRAALAADQKRPAPAQRADEEEARAREVSGLEEMLREADGGPAGADGGGEEGGGAEGEEEEVEEGGGGVGEDGFVAREGQEGEEEGEEFEDGGKGGEEVGDGDV